MNAYFDTKHPAGYTGVTALSNTTGLPQNEVKNFLRSHEAYTLHAPARKRFARNYYKASKVDDTWQADLCDMRHLVKDNDGYNYLLTVVDVLSKYAWAVPLKSKTAESVKNAFAEIMQERKPKNLMTDKGKEFVNAVVQKFLKDNGIHFYTSNNPDIKAGIAERFNRTLKTRMWKYFTHMKTRKYIDVLPNFLYAYNHARHSSIKMTPTQALDNEREARRNLYAGKPKEQQAPKLAVGDHVRISREKSIV